MKMMSLYDYLGRAAGMELGEQVAKVATASGVKMDTRYVSNTNSVYTGNVTLYPESFLNYTLNNSVSLYAQNTWQIKIY
jgi:hypothetical protein